MRAGYCNSIQQKIIKRKGYKVIIIGILLFLQCTIISVNADPLQKRWGHSSILINNGLYVYGGRTDPKNIAVDTSNINELLYLDVSKPFDILNPPLEAKGNANGITLPFLSFHTCSSGGNQNELLILFGGESREQTPKENSVFVYNTLSETWSVPPMTGLSPSRRKGHTAVPAVPASNSIIWGGIPADDSGILVEFKELYRLAVTGGTTIAWRPVENSPFGRYDHSATLLNDGKMYIIGGVSGNVLALMTEILVYDTNQGTWNTLTATGDQNQIPVQRQLHGAVGTEDNRIIIYGGTTMTLAGKFADIAVLNVTGNGLIWTIPPAAGTQPPGRYSHSMTLVGSKAIVTYGLVDDFTTGGNVFVLDVNSYTWDSSYNPVVAPAAPVTKSSDITTTGVSATPTDTKTDTTDTANSNQIGVSGNSSTSGSRNLGILIGIPVAAGVIVLVLAGLLCFWIRKRKKQPSFATTPYEKQQASIPPIAGPAPLYNISSSQGGAGGSTNIAPFIPPFATSSYPRRQSSFGSISETRNLTPVDQHDSWGSAPSNSSQSQLPQINSYSEKNNYQRPSSPRAAYLPSTPPPQHHHSNIPPTPPPSTPTPPPVSPQKDLFPVSSAAGASSSTKTSSSNLRLDSDSNTAPVEYAYNLPPVAPLVINRTRTPSPQAQAQAQAQAQQPPLLPISTSLSSPQDSSDIFASSPTEIEATETTTSTTEDSGTNGFNSPLLRSETLSAVAGTAAADRTLSLRSVPRLNTSRNSSGLSSPPPITARLRSSTLDGNVTGSSRPTSPVSNNNTSDNQTPRGRLFVANPDSPDDSD